MVNILFICSGNVFRSMSAKLLLEKYIKERKIKDLNVDSAGISFKSFQKINSEVLEELEKLDVTVLNHKPKQVLKKHINWADLIVCMGYNHKRYIKEKFDRESFLFNKICYGVNYPVYDNCEILKNNKGFVRNVFDKCVIRKINKDLFYFLKNYKKFI